MPPKLIHLVRGDLDWIVMKCLEKDRTRRYETANGLAADLKRHLNNEPVVARPPSAAYRLQKACGGTSSPSRQAVARRGGAGRWHWHQHLAGGGGDPRQGRGRLKPRPKL